MQAVPRPIKDPEDYLKGVDPPERIVTRNVLLFERPTQKTLQQANLSNRMHHRHVLLRVMETPGVVSLDGKAIQLEAGDCLLITPYQFHTYLELARSKLRWSFITFDLLQGKNWLQEFAYRPQRLDGPATLLWDEMIEFWSRPDEASRMQVLTMLDRLLMHLHQSLLKTNASRPRADAQRMKHTWVAEIEALIIQSVHQKWSLEEMASRSGQSYRRLRKCFREAMGVSMKDFRANYQLHLAISHMRNQQLNLSEVAELSGFQSSSAFSRFVRQHAGQSPRDLRKQGSG